MALAKEGNKKLKPIKKAFNLVKRERKSTTLFNQNKLTCPKEEAKPTKAKNPQKMSHLNEHS